MYPVMLMQLTKIGMNPEVLETSAPAVLTALKAAIPEQAAYIEKQGLSSLFHLLQPLEDKLLEALVASLSGREASEAAVRHAAEILEKVQEADAAMKPPPPVPA